MNIIIIEDEKPAARRLSRMLEKFGLQAQIMLHSVEEAIDWFSNHTHPDLIFLDIQLSDGLCFEIFDAVVIKSAVIFTTAYDEYALQAFKLNSIDYLLKPIDETELKKSIQQYQERIPDKTPLKVDFEDIKKLLVNPIGRTYKKRFSVKIGQHIKLINIDEVVCFYSKNKGTYIHTFKDRDYLIDQTLEQLEQELQPQSFFRINRKLIVNIKAIEDIISYSNSRLALKLSNFEPEEKIIVSRERVRDFKDWLD
ncbi:MAG: DNA-binding response regulator [Flavobacteriales bacterium]|nr:MAG: DNA-binding response regulator [Flavobacteriales bacterium]